MTAAIIIGVIVAGIAGAMITAKLVGLNSDDEGGE